MDESHTLAAPPGLRAVTLADRDLFVRTLAGCAEPISDMSFTTTFGWAEALYLLVGEIEGHVCLFSAADGDLSMMLPPLELDRAERHRLPRALGACFSLMDGANADRPGVGRSRIEYVSDELLERVRVWGGMELATSPMPGDFVYPTRAMATLEGGSLKGQRTLRSRFLEDHPGVETRPLADADVPACLELLERWRVSGDRRHEGEANERLIGTDVLRARDVSCTRRLLAHSEALRLESLGVWHEGRLLGFTLGELLTPAMGVVHVEKTEPGLEGAAPFIAASFCAGPLGSSAEVNAGDDWGIDALRTTKTSYRPSRLLNKSMLLRGRESPAAVGVEPTVLRTLSARPALVHARREAREQKVELRRAGPADAGGIGALELACFAHPGERFSARQVRGLLANPRATAEVAIAEDRIVGWAVSLVRTHRNGRSGRVYGIAVDPAMGGRGIGGRLLGRAIDAMRAMGVERIYLEVRTDNTPAIALYTRAGFEVVQTLRDYYAPGLDGVRMRLAQSPSPQRDRPQDDRDGHDETGYDGGGPKARGS